MPSYNYRGGGEGASRVSFLIIIIIAIVVNENGLKMITTVEGRTWPRMVQKEVPHQNAVIYSPSSSTEPHNKDYSSPASTNSLTNETGKAPKSEINSNLSSILPSSLHFAKAGEDGNNNNRNGGAAADHQDSNGSESSRCNRRSRHPHYHHHSRNISSGSSNNDDYNGESSRWWTFNSTNCLAGPFHLGADVNESVYSALCPLSSSATNGKFSIPGLQCRGGDWYTQCNHNKQHDKSMFTVHKCEEGQMFAEVEKGCVRKSRKGKIDPLLSSETACPMDREDEAYSDDVILHWLLLQVMAPFQYPYESKVGRIVNNLQSLEEQDSSSRSNDDFNDDLETLCKSTSPLSHHSGLHPHPHLCSMYVQCAASGNGSFFLQSCGPGTVFNPELHICDWPANVPRCSSGNENEVLRRRRTAAISSEFDTIEQTRCNFTGLRPDPQFCNKYRLCSAGGVETVHTCGLGTVFNTLSDVCDFADEVDCSSRKSDLGTYGCDEEDQYRAPHPEYCNKFVECHKGTLAVKTCSPATLYDREEERCDHAFKITCRKPIFLEHDVIVNVGHPHHNDHEDSLSEVIRRKRRSTMMLPYWRSKRRNQLNLACEENYIAPHPHSCTRFVECENGRIFVKSCGPGTAYNPSIGKCDWPYKVLEPNPQDCTSYQQCYRDGYRKKFCRPGHYFDDKTKTCVPGTPYQIANCRGGTTTTTLRPTTTTRPWFETPPPS